jgi:hypothetical protein
MLPGHWTLVGSGPVYGDGAAPQMRRPRVRLPGSPGNPRNIVRSLLAKQNLAESGRPQPRPRRGYVPESPLTDRPLFLLAGKPDSHCPDRESGGSPRCGETARNGIVALTASCPLSTDNRRMARSGIQANG